jgi:chromosome segregation ATPase
LDFSKPKKKDAKGKKSFDKLNEKYLQQLQELSDRIEKLAPNMNAINKFKEIAERYDNTTKEFEQVLQKCQEITSKFEEIKKERYPSTLQS